MNAACELTELFERLRELLARAVQQCRSGGWVVWSFDSMSRRATEMATSRCWAPSCRFRSSTRWLVLGADDSGPRGTEPPP